MNIKINFVGQFILFSILVFSSCTAFSSQDASAEKVLLDFYQAYINEIGGEGSELVGKHVVNNVVQSINNSFQCNYDSDNTDDYKKVCAKKRDCKNSKGDYICNWNGVWVETDVNYFTKSQDFYPSWSQCITITRLKENATGAEFKVSLGEFPEPVMKLQVKLVLVEHTWKISSVMKY